MNDFHGTNGYPTACHVTRKTNRSNQLRASGLRRNQPPIELPTVKRTGWDIPGGFEASKINRRPWLAAEFSVSINAVFLSDARYPNGVPLMPLSIWEYLRARTRDAVLAGFNDALDLVEQGDSNGNQHVAATQLVTRMKLQAERTLPEPSDGPRPSVHTQPSTNGHAAHAVSELLATPQKPSGNARRPVEFDDELEQRLDAAAPQNGKEKPSAADARPAGPPPGRLTEKKRRGRPPKNKQD